MKEFPKEVVSRYIGSGGSNCPYCGSPDISNEATTYDVGDLWQGCRCDMCGRKWCEIYKLTDIEMIGEE
jgi:hypothetical protein